MWKEKFKSNKGLSVSIALGTLILFIGGYLFFTNQINLGENRQEEIVAPSGKTGMLSSSNIPAPYNKFDYLYTVSVGIDDNNPRYFFYRNDKQYAGSQIINSVLKPLSDGTGFYQLKYASAVDEGNSIPCGDQKIKNYGGVTRDGSNTTCVTHNNQNYIAIDWPDWADKTNVVYQECKKMKFYSRDIIDLPGENNCEEIALKINNDVIDTTSEGLNAVFGNPGKKLLVGAANFQSVRMINGKLTYLKIDPSSDNYVFVVYDLSTGEKTEIKNYDGKSIANAELVNGAPAFLVYNGDNLSKDFYYQNQKVSNVDAFKFYEGDFYFLKFDPATNKTASKGMTLLKGDIGLRHFNGDFYDYTLSHDLIGVYPNCKSNNLVCLFGVGNFATQSAGISGKNPLYVNLTEPLNDFGIMVLDNIFVFSENNTTYIVYDEPHKLLGKNLNTGEVTVLFEFDEAYMRDVKVFPKM